METTLRAPSLCPDVKVKKKTNHDIERHNVSKRKARRKFHLFCNTAYPKLLTFPNLAYEDWVCRGVIWVTRSSGWGWVCGLGVSVIHELKKKKRRKRGKTEANALFPTG